jgi:DNA-binding transcriptional ArsR family regulator
MIEKIVTSKTRIKILELFLSHIDNRYYLRELERLMEESLSPLRRQLLKLVSAGILITEEEANLKYYRLNKDFEGLEELKELVLGKGESSKGIQLQGEGINPSGFHDGDSLKAEFHGIKRFRYDLAFLSFVSVFVLITAIFVVYANNKNMKKAIDLVSGAKPQAPVINKAVVSNGEMYSRRWKVMPGNIPVLSSGATDVEEKSKEL